MEDGKQIEPTHFLPIVPMVLINGAAGIGTGFSTYVPNHSLEDVIANVRRLLAGLDPEPMVPSWTGFAGAVECLGENDFSVRGAWERIKDTSVRVTELPIGTSIDAYKAFLESDKSGVQRFDNNSTDVSIDFTLHFEKERLEAVLPDIEKEMGLKRKISCSNMHLFDKSGHIRRFETTADILREFFSVRLDMYGRRLRHLIGAKEEELAACTYRSLFVSKVLEGSIRLLNAKRVDVRADMGAVGLPPPHHDRLLSMPLSSLTQDEVQRLESEKEALEHELASLKQKDAALLWEEDLRSLERACGIGA